MEYIFIITSASANIICILKKMEGTREKTGNVLMGYELVS